ncbi:hypothetical protein [Flavobacterium ardleyense]
MSLISTSLASTFFVCFTLFAIMESIYFFKVSTSVNLGANYKFWILSFTFVIWFLNYYLFIKPRNFLRRDFTKDRKGGLVIVCIVFFIGILFVIGANKNREKIVEEVENARIENNL